MVRDLLSACAVLDGEGLTTAFGHVTSRGANGTVLVTGNQGPGLVRHPADVVTVDGRGTVLEGDPLKLPGELAMHLGILAARPEAGAVCRFHGPACLAWSTLGRSLPATLGMGLFIGHEVPWFDTATTVRTREQGAALAACLGDAHGVLLRGFGAATVGRTVAEAVVRAWLLERNAAAALAASAAGTPRPFDAAAAAPFAAGEGPAATQIARAWTWLRARHPTPTPTDQEVLRA